MENALDDTRAALRVAVVGLGKMGLPLAAYYAAHGANVTGCDVNQAVVDAVNAGRSHIHEEPGLADAVASGVASGRLRATTDTAGATSVANVVVVIVPVVVTMVHEVDFTRLDEAVRAIGAGLRPGCLVILETTVPVGTTRRIGRILAERSGLRVGRDFYLAFSPERLYCGRIFEDLRRYPKIVGGIDAKSSAQSVKFYRRVLDAPVQSVSNAETAEFTKLAETAYRDVNIALANQLALYAGARTIDVQEAFDAANTQPYAHLHRSSIGVGGHCIPVYPHFLLNDRVGTELEMLQVARATNDGMAAVAVQQLQCSLDGLSGRRILVLGMAYRENVKELAFSVGPRLVRLLQEQGAKVAINDPLFTAAELAFLSAETVDLAAPLAIDAVVIQAFHNAYRQLDWRIFRGIKVVLDGRGALNDAALAGTGARYVRIADQGALASRLEVATTA